MTTAWRTYRNNKHLKYHVAPARARTVFYYPSGNSNKPRLIRQNFPTMLFSWNGRRLRIAEVIGKWRGPTKSRVRTIRISNLLPAKIFMETIICESCLGSAANENIYFGLLDPVNAFWMTTFEYKPLLGSGSTKNWPIHEFTVDEWLGAHSDAPGSKP